MMKPKEEHLTNDRYPVYTKVKKMLKQMLKLNHQGQFVTLTMMISGIVMGRNAQLSVMRIVWIEKNTTWRYVLRTSPQIYVQIGQLNQPVRD